MAENKSVLIIDDEEWFYEGIMERMAAQGITYDFARTGQEGLKKWENNNYKVIALDMKLSLGDELSRSSGGGAIPGLIILKQIKAKSPNFPVICFTVLSDEDAGKRIAKLGGIHIAKGIKKAYLRLIDEIKKHL